MRSASTMRLLVAGSLCALTIGAAATSYDSPNRHELKRTDLSGAPGMEVITSISVYEVGQGIPRHVHHGVETGSPILNLRDVPHAGFKIVGPEPLKLLTVHVVDKDKPLYDWVN